jgi:hypothetical protein
MNYEQTLVERRDHVRVNARGPVIMRAAGREIHGRAVVVSETTLEVRCQLGFMLLSLAGAAVEIEMRLDGAAGNWFSLRGHVSHIRAANHSLVIAIDALPPPLAALLAGPIEPIPEFDDRSTESSNVTSRSRPAWPWSTRPLWSSSNTSTDGSTSSDSLRAPNHATPDVALWRESSPGRERDGGARSRRLGLIHHAGSYAEHIGFGLTTAAATRALNAR